MSNLTFTDIEIEMEKLNQHLQTENLFQYPKIQTREKNKLEVEHNVTEFSRKTATRKEKVKLRIEHNVLEFQVKKFKGNKESSILWFYN